MLNVQTIHIQLYRKAVQQASSHRPRPSQAEARVRDSAPAKRWAMLNLKPLVGSRSTSVNAQWLLAQRPQLMQQYWAPAHQPAADAAAHSTVGSNGRATARKK
eukprot:4360131-Prymnesium_polylepis.1